MKRLLVRLEALRIAQIKELFFWKKCIWK